MRIDEAFREFAGIVERLEATGLSIVDVSAPNGSLLDDGDARVSVTVGVPLPADTDDEGNVSISIGQIEMRRDELLVDLAVSTPVGVEVATDTDDASGASSATGRPAPEPDSNLDGHQAAVVTNGAESSEDGTPTSESVGVRRAVQQTRNGRAADRDAEQSDAEEDETAKEEDFTRGGGTVSTAGTGNDNSPGTDDKDDEDDEGEAGDTIRTNAEDQGLPPHRDPDRLRAVYEECETFPEMTEALGAEVTPQTVRHHMIKLGIHVPQLSNDENGGDTDSEADANATAADGDGGASESAEESTGGDRRNDTGLQLPDSISLEDVTEAVGSSTTLHQVRRQLGLDPEETRDLLQRLDLIDMVTGRLATQSTDRPPIEEIEERIQAAITS